MKNVHTNKKGSQKSGIIQKIGRKTQHLGTRSGSFKQGIAQSNATGNEGNESLTLAVKWLASMYT